MTKAKIAWPILACAFVFTGTAPAAEMQFLAHGSRLTVAQKVAYFERSVKHEGDVMRFLTAADAPRTAERPKLVRWYTKALRWHRHLLADYRAKLEPQSPRAYARLLALAQGWSGYEWEALDTIVGHESSWNPCRHYPSTTDCGYTGASACGIPQRNPCPASWRGRLAASWKEQVVELIRYVRERYGTPSHALSIWNYQRSY